MEHKKSTQNSKLRLGSGPERLNRRDIMQKVPRAITGVAEHRKKSNAAGGERDQLGEYR